MKISGAHLSETLVASLKTEFKKADWWDEVQEDVRTRLGWVIDHVEQVGSLFCRTFLTFFRWEFERRRTEGENITNPMAGYVVSLLGVRISEETFQCGKLPTRAVLGLYDYISPNDADVTACMFLCHRIETLQLSGLLQIQEEKLSATQDEIGEVFRRIAQERKTKKGQESQTNVGELIKWDFEEDQNISN